MSSRLDHKDDAKNFNAPGPTISISLAAFIFVSFVILVGLGTWQWQKIEPKLALIAKVENGLQQARQPIKAVSKGLELAYKPVELDGQFTHKTPMPVFGTDLDGKPGYHLYGLMTVASVGPVIASYGFIPFEEKTAKDKDLPRLPTDKRHWRGVVIPAPVKSSFTSDNEAKKNDWYWVDISAMATKQGVKVEELGRFVDYRLILGDASDPVSPKGGQFRVDFPNNHFQYAMTWYGLAASLLLVFGALWVKNKRAKHNLETTETL